MHGMEMLHVAIHLVAVIFPAWMTWESIVTIHFSNWLTLITHTSNVPLQIARVHGI